ncbi:uncharacterized protein [Rutidosis leptorrhynchoides]|uniref:uncharacterized protein n=1 Tax=Rutidosis leptorrhynchoides TaxID=125765 RepID=UPI003A99762E
MNVFVLTVNVDPWKWKTIGRRKCRYVTVSVELEGKEMRGGESRNYGEEMKPDLCAVSGEGYIGQGWAPATPKTFVLRGKKTQLKKITSFFKRQSNNIIEDETQEAKRSKASTDEEQVEHPNQSDEPQHQNQPSEHPAERLDNVEVDYDFLERDPGKRQPIWKYPIIQEELVRRSYLKAGPFQVRLNKYPFKGKDKRRFQYSWFNIFLNWLEYSPTTDSAYCFICYLYSDKPNVRSGTDAFTIKDSTIEKNSQHRVAVLFCENLLNTKAHIQNLIVKKNEEERLKNRIRLKASVDVVPWLTFQACAFRGHDETVDSKNRGNFIELLKLLASYDDEVSKVVLQNAPYNSRYTSSDIQKEILSFIGNKVRKHIRNEVGNSYFCIMVDEALDEAKREQMAIALRFVDKDRIIR